ncbi:MAG: hypothetical protein KFW07_04260 [Mycoplasmataceae bacterium]|nr:hypothetical protein [Mycoplasmataceae bacterium]
MYSNWNNSVLPVINDQATKSIRVPHPQQFVKPAQQTVQQQYKRETPIGVNDYYSMNNSTIPMKVNGVDMASYNGGRNHRNERNMIREQMQNYMQQQPINKILKTQFERNVNQPKIDIQESIIAINKLTKAINNLSEIQSMNLELNQQSFSNDSNGFNLGFDTTNLQIKLSTLNDLLDQGGISLEDYDRIRREIIAQEIDNNF